MFAHVSNHANAKHIPEGKNGDGGPECIMAPLTSSLNAGHPANSDENTAAWHPEYKVPATFNVAVKTTMLLLRIDNTAMKLFVCLNG